MLFVDSMTSPLSKARSDNLMTVKRIGTITGKPRIAMRVALLLALEAIAEIKVNAIEKPVWKVVQLLD